MNRLGAVTGSLTGLDTGQLCFFDSVNVQLKLLELDEVPGLLAIVKTLFAIMRFTVSIVKTREQNIRLWTE